MLDLGLVHQIIDKADKEGCHLLEVGPEVEGSLLVSQWEPSESFLETRARRNLETWSTRGSGLAEAGLLLPTREGQGGKDLRAMGGL